MIYLIEGPDGAGKSTLIKQLIEQGYNEYSGVPRDWPDQLEHWKILFDSCNFTDVVIDRCFISELVYRSVKKDLSPSVTIQEIIELLTDYDVKIIYCNTDTAFNDAMARGESYVTNKDEFDKISKGYDFLMDMLSTFVGVPIIKYDWHETNAIETLLRNMF